MQYVAVGGGRIPALGFGSYGMSTEEMLRMIPHALRAGFRHVDTAQVYGNEEGVGAGIEASGVPRSEVFITTKVWVANYAKSRFAASVDESLRKLRTDYIDLLLLHWPFDGVPLAEQIGTLNELVDVGKVRQIGVSNFNLALMRQSVNLTRHPLVTNQVEYHPYLNQSTLIAGAREAGMTVTAYCAMAVGRVFAEPLLQEIARRHQKSVSQVVLRWLIQQDGVIALSRTVQESRVAQNVEIFNFELTNEEMAAVHSLAAPRSRIVSPPGLAPAWD
ncbi:MAG: aldo/keto reductase [Nevskia sp.]|nr:aldo/keto reductase [Nevskia sp.]